MLFFIPPPLDAQTYTAAGRPVANHFKGVEMDIEREESMELQKGANVPIGQALLAVMTEFCAPAGWDVDVSAFLLMEDGKVRDDHDMIFYNQPEGRDGALRLVEKRASAAHFEVDPARLSADIARVVFCVTIDEVEPRRQTLASLTNARIAVSVNGHEIVGFRPPLEGASEAAMIFGELYRRRSEWKFRAVGQGFNGGLAPLARSFGIEVTDEVTHRPPAERESKISLDKPGQSVSLGKHGTAFGEIVINLNWSRVASAIDLDLGCLYELWDGTIMVVQAIGDAFGSLDAPPYIKLEGDDRTGDVGEGETLRINGAYWGRIKRVAIFAHIYRGVPNWSATDGVVLVSMPGQPAIEVRLTDGHDDRWLCGVVLLENAGGALQATRLVRYYPGREELDADLRWGIRWIPMTKN